MSFWTKSTGEQATGTVEDNDFKAIPKGPRKCIISKAEVKIWEGIKSVSFRFDIVEGEFSKRIIFAGLKCWDKDDKKRDRAIELLCKAFSVTNTKLPDGEPTDTDLAKLCDKPLMVNFGYFQPDEPGKEAINFLKNFEAISKTVKPTAKTAPAKMAEFVEPDDSAHVDEDSIPF